MINIKRTRYVVVREILEGRTEMFCGLARNYEFKSIENIGNTSIKTYSSQNKAKSSVISSWCGTKTGFENGTYKVVKVVETIVEAV